MTPQTHSQSEFVASHVMASLVDQVDEIDFGDPPQEEQQLESAKVSLPPLELFMVEKERPGTAVGRILREPSVADPLPRPRTVSAIRLQRPPQPRTQRAAPAPRQGWWDGTTFDPNGTLEARNAAAAFIAGGPLPMGPPKLPQLSSRKSANPDGVSAEELRARGLRAISQSPYAAQTRRRPPADQSRQRLSSSDASLQHSPVRGECVSTRHLRIRDRASQSPSPFLPHSTQVTTTVPTHVGYGNDFDSNTHRDGPQTPHARRSVVWPDSGGAAGGGRRRSNWGGDKNKSQKKQKPLDAMVSSGAPSRAPQSALCTTHPVTLSKTHCEYAALLEQSKEAQRAMAEARLSLEDIGTQRTMLQVCCLDKSGAAQSTWDLVASTESIPRKEGMLPADG